jgi:hypothetical protein
MKKESAVDWMFDQLWETPKDKLAWFNILMKAKEMEKEQIKEAHLNGQAEWDIQSLGDTQKKLSEQYYKETFQTKEK